MYRQVGDLKLNNQGLAVRGLLVRHLVMPGGLAEAGEIFDFLADLSKIIYINVMEQYRPCFKAADYPPLDKASARSIKSIVICTSLHQIMSSNMKRAIAKA